MIEEGGRGSGFISQLDTRVLYYIYMVVEDCKLYFGRWIARSLGKRGGDISARGGQVRSIYMCSYQIYVLAPLSVCVFMESFHIQLKLHMCKMVFLLLTLELACVNQCMGSVDLFSIFS